MVINSHFWKKRKVLITGHTGFKGSWLSLWLQKLGTELVGFSNSIPTKPSLFEDAKIEDGMISIKGDIRNHDELERVLLEYKPEIVFHLAAQSLVHKSYQDPTETYSTNVMGTTNLLEITRKMNTPRTIICVTSDKCYKNTGSTRPYVEDDPIGGYDPYSSSKGCAELIIDAYRNSYFNSQNFEQHKIGIASVRAGNVIGGGDWSAYRLIPDIMKGVLKNETIRIRKPDAIRHWQYVLDPLHGYLLLGEKLHDNGAEFAESWNFGSTLDDAKSVSWILEKIKQYWQNGIRWEIDKEEFKHEADYLVLDSHKARSRLGWKSKIDLDTSINLIVEWYKEYQRNGDIKKICELQIKRFQNMD